jgi:hypothetical protein
MHYTVQYIYCMYYRVLYSVCKVYEPAIEKYSVAEPHHVDAAPAPAPAPTLLNAKPTFLKQAKVNTIIRVIFLLISSDLL